MTDIRLFSEITPNDAAVVGGKGLSLGLMAAADLPVPPGFCITTVAYRSSDGVLRPPLLDAVFQEYQNLGRGLVAVRSSATGEDGAVTSFAGQQETILGVEGEEALKEAVERCWASLYTDRAVAYRQKQGVDERGLAMAVVVQRLVHAETAGVLFTHDPHDITGEHMLIEASWGLGEVVVSGRVTPDSFQVSRSTGTITNKRLGLKKIQITAGGEQAVPADRQEQFCLTERQLADLVNLGQRVEAFYGEPRDIEWAFADGRCWLLQARPITTTDAGEREEFRRAEIERLRRIAGGKKTVWSRFNLIEVLPNPTPMTWAVVECLLSGKGGSGLMYRDLGFRPSSKLDHCTVYDLIGGRPYCNLSREPYMQARWPQVDYPFARYKKSPMLALAPEPDPASMYRGVGRICRLPFFIWRQVRFARRIGKLSKTFAEQFRLKTIPRFVKDLEEGERENVSRYDLGALMQRFEVWVQRTLIDFARDSLKPTLFAQFEMQVLEQQLRKPLGLERAQAAIAELCSGIHPDPEADFAQGIRDVTAGALSRDEFLKKFGHRGRQEMELSVPRWRENPAALDEMLHPSTLNFTRNMEPMAERWQRIAAEAKLNNFLIKWLGEHVDRLQVYLGLRETAKHYLMRGYAIIRQSLMELDRHFHLDGGIFYLVPQELPKLIQKKNMLPLIEERRKTRAQALSLEVPPVVFSDDLEAIGRPLPPPVGATQMHGVPLSAGVAIGPALVLSEPSAVVDEPGYILVCPSTDPAWVPLFVHAKGLVMESGGSLSHGAIVAREFGLPAVAGLPDIHRQLRTGQRIHVDGSRGTVTIISE